MCLVCFQKDVLCFFLAVLCVKSVHGLVIKSNDPFCSFYDSLEKLCLCLGGVPKPGSDAVCEYVLYKSFVCLDDRMMSKSVLPQQEDVAGLFFYCSGATVVELLTQLRFVVT